MTPTDHGHAIHPNVFERAEMARTLEAIGAADIVRTKAGARHMLTVPAVRDLASDPRLTRIAAQILGRPAPVPFRATLFDKSFNANWLVAWHQDTALPLTSRGKDATWGPWSVKAGVLYARAPAWALETVVALRVSLDDSTPSNGPLRVLPDTHRRGVLSDAAIAQFAGTIAPVDCVALAGGVVVMRPLIVHASSKGSDGQPRRVLHLEYAAAIDLGPGIELVVG